MREFFRSVLFLPLGVRRGDVSRSKYRAGDFPLEFSDEIAEISTVVSGGRRADLHDAQVSAKLMSDAALKIDGGTSVWNFSPQGGGGVHYFLRRKRSIDLGVNGVHISSASLGDRNPGVNASVQVQVGYTFWR